ncbi:MAG: hypothetical protein GKR77_03380 [Legionellales bacterium]|nr:hypothetical protein [Legionellales bacterium]
MNRSNLFDTNPNPLRNAIDNDNADEIRLCLVEDQSLAQTPIVNLSPLNHAVTFGKIAAVETLLSLSKEGFNINPVESAETNGKTPLHLAALNAYPNVVDLLLPYYQETLDVKDKKGNTPLMLAEKCLQRELETKASLADLKYQSTESFQARPKFDDEELEEYADKTILAYQQVIERLHAAAELQQVAEKSVEQEEVNTSEVITSRRVGALN